MSKKLIVAGVVLTLVAAVLFGVSASAQSVSCANIDSLLSLMGVTDAAKIAVAKTSMGCGAAAPAVSFTRDLTVGSTGADVTALQTMLGVSPATGYFGPITKAAVQAYQTSKGITATGYVGPLTRAALNYVAPVVVVPPVTPVTPGTSNLEGGAGDIVLTDTNTGVKNSLKEGEENVKVLGVKAEADGSDIAVTSIKVTLKNASTTDGSSEKLSNYLDAVSIYMDSKKVGSADVSDFSKTSDTPDTFSKTISLKDAIIKDGADVKLYVAVSAVSGIDTDDLVAHLKLDVNTVRFTDGTGAILTASDSVAQQDFSFDASSVDTNFTMKTSSSNPDNETITVDDNEDSVTDALALVFKLDVADDSEDISITSIPVTLTVTGNGASTDSIEDIVDSVTVNVAGSDYTADLTTDSILNGSGTAVYTVDIDTGDVELSGGDVKDVKVSLGLKGTDGTNYVENTTITASVGTDTIDAETADDELTADQKDGTTKTGATLTLSTSAVTLSAISWTKAEGTDAATIDLFFTLEAGQNDITGFAKSDVVETTKTNISGAGVLTQISGDAVETSTGVFDIGSGDSGNFRVRYTVTATGGEVKISTVKGQVVPDAKKLSPTAYYQ